MLTVAGVLMTSCREDSFEGMEIEEVRATDGDGNPINPPPPPPPEAN